MHKDLAIVFALLVGLGIAWIATGGPSRALVAGPFLKPPAPLNTGESYGLFFNLGRYLDGSERSPWGISSISRSDDSDTSPVDTPTSLGTYSTHRSNVSLSRARAKDDDPDEEYVEINVSRNAKDRIVITGWTLESSVTGRSVTIDKGVYLPETGVVSSEQAIALDPGSEVFVISGRSPIGSSFRLNACTGYFEQFQDFEPRLDRSCPSAEVEFDFRAPGLHFDDECLDYIEDIPKCSMQLNPPVRLSNECRGFVDEHIHYTGCVKNHRADTNFYQNEWRIYLNRDDELWKSKREIIRLLDRNGKVVDEITY
jgi:hypothetical protein